MTRPAAKFLVPNQRLQRWAFDVELVYLAQKLNVPMAEVQVGTLQDSVFCLHCVLSLLSCTATIVINKLTRPNGFPVWDSKGSG